MIYLGILERGFLFFSLVGDWLERMGMILVFCVQNRDLLYIYCIEREVGSERRRR